MHARLAITSFVASGLLLAGCAGATDEPSAALPTLANSVTTTPETGDETPDPSTSTETPSEPTPAPTPAGPQPITSDDLIDVLPRPGQMSNVQDGKFVRSLDGFPDEPGADWAADAPLTKKQRDQINLGDLRKTKPAVCQYVAFLDAGWTADEWAGQDYVTAAAQSWMAQDLNLSNFRRNNQISEFTTRIYVMPPGEAETWLANAVNTLRKCARYKQVDAKGKITNVTTPSGTIKRSGATYVWEHDFSASGIRVRFADTWEAVGNALLVTRLSMWNPSPAGVERGAKVFNNIADKLAKAQGITREPLDLEDLTKVKQDPTLVKSPSIPASAQV